MMSRIKQQLNKIILLLLGAFTVFSVYGAFIGAERAKAFFNSAALVIFWCGLLLVLIVAFFVYVSLRKRSALMLIHLGCILILAGGMYGSQKGHVAVEFAVKFSARFMAGPRPRSDQSSKDRLFTKGMIQLYEGQIFDRVVLGSETNTAELPFSVRLKEVFVEYYDKPQIVFYLSEEKYYSIPINIGEVFVLPNEQGTIEINAAYKNFKMTQQDGQMETYDSPESGFNPAYKLTYTSKDQRPYPFFVFEWFGMHAMPGQTFRAEFVPPRKVKDYKSTLQIVEKDKIVKEKTIEVNKPLYYGGYHFYQNTFAYDDLGPISGILITSARGVWVVFTGYGMIFVGLVLRFWSKILKWGMR